MFKGLKGITVLVAAAVVVVGIGYAGYVSSHESSRDVAMPGVVRVADPGEQLRVTLDPKNFQGDVRKAYEAAERNPALLAQMHCYCGCDKADGHKNLLDCFRDSHGSTCAICVACATPSVVSVVILLTSEKSVDSMNSISPSNICALLAKWR